MRQRDLKPDTAYADCSGRLWKTGEDLQVYVTLYWYEDTADGKHVVRKQEVVPAASAKFGGSDPWGRCTVATPGSPRKREERRGVKMTQWSIDRDGNPVDELLSDLVNLRDVPGTWKEYLTLHAEDVKKKFDQEAIEAARREWIAAASELAAAHQIQVSAGLVWSRHRKPAVYEPEIQVKGDAALKILKLVCGDKMPEFPAIVPRQK